MFVFQDPVPIKKWTGIKDATKYGPISMQYDPVARIKSEDEDCLHLNVYVKAAIEPNTRKAVMVWIHGGAFLFGSSHDTLYGPDYLLMHDIVLVTVNYRLGVLGKKTVYISSIYHSMIWFKIFSSFSKRLFKPRRRVCHGKPRPQRPSYGPSMGPREYRKLRRRSR